MKSGQQKNGGEQSGPITEQVKEMHIGAAAMWFIILRRNRFCDNHLDDSKSNPQNQLLWRIKWEYTRRVCIA